MMKVLFGKDGPDRTHGSASFDHVLMGVVAYAFLATTLVELDGHNLGVASSHAIHTFAPIVGGVLGGIIGYVTRRGHNTASHNAE